MYTLNSCLVPECEAANNTKYASDWVKDILPGSISDSSPEHFIPYKCSKYKFIANTSDFLLENETCQTNWFDNEKIRCHEWVFDRAGTSIVNDVRNCVFLWVLLLNNNNKCFIVENNYLIENNFYKIGETSITIHPFLYL